MPGRFQEGDERRARGSCLGTAGDGGVAADELVGGGVSERSGKDETGEPGLRPVKRWTPPSEAPLLSTA